tara:strand:- start:323 stop:862 length:540 start_codon:yes stop_codon:yes gene_type:complete
MGAAAERRALLLEADDSYDPFLTVNVDEYLIENYSTLTAKNRQSIRHLCQNDEEFDYDSIHDQIDDCVFQFADDNPDVILEDESIADEASKDESEISVDDDDDIDDDEIESIVYVDVEEYLQDNYDEIDEEEMAYMIELITYKFDYSNVYDQIDQIVSNYNDGQYDDELDEISEEQTAE